MAQRIARAEEAAIQGEAHCADVFDTQDCQRIADEVWVRICITCSCCLYKVGTDPREEQSVALPGCAY
jgi:hypothetical protein